MARRAPLWLVLMVLCGSWAAAAPKEKSPPPKDDYYDLYKTLVDTMDQVERNYVKEVDRRELFEAAIRGVLNRLDPYSSYIPPKELAHFRSSVESEFGGIGIQIAIDAGQLKVLSPLVGTPAYHAGLMAGDRIIEIDGKNTDGLGLDEAVAQLKGKEGSTVTLTVVHPGKSRKEKPITIARERIHVETVMGDRRKADDSWDFMLDPKEKLGYLRLSAFSRDTAAELRNALDELQAEKLRGLILDLRFNPGGLLSSAIDVSNLFISHGRIVSTKGRNSPERVWNAHKDGAYEGFPLVVLMNRYSASASEIVAACLQDHKRAVIVGERSWGKGSVQNVIELENGRSALKLTTAGYRRPNGKNIDRLEAKDSDEWGVKPDKGFELKLSDRDTVALIEDRRQRDVVRPSHAEETKTVAAAQESAEDAAGSKTEATESKDETTSAPPDDNGMPKDQDRVPRSKPSEKVADAEDHSRPDGAGAAFEDRQLQMAVKYLSGELARAK